MDGADSNSQNAIRTLETLSVREREVLALLAQGGTAKSVSQRLGISPRTVEVHAASIVVKLRARNRMHAVAIAVYVGTIVPYEATRESLLGLDGSLDMGLEGRAGTALRRP